MAKEYKNSTLIQIKKPSFQKSRFEIQQAKNQQKEISTIKEIHRPNLEKLSIIELKNLLKKQEKFLQNKLLINKLKDKGLKIKKFRDDIQNELKNREHNLDQDVVKTEELLVKMEIKSEDDDEEMKVVDSKPNKISNPLIANHAKIFNDQNDSDSNKYKRFNQTQNFETFLNQRKIRTVKLLNFQESMENSMKTSEKERYLSQKQMVRFYDYRTRDDESESDDFDDDNDTYVSVNFTDYY